MVPTDAVAFSSAHFGRGVGPIYLGNVYCSGRESNLTDCSRSSAEFCYGGHGGDAGVRCQGTSVCNYVRILSSKLIQCHPIDSLQSVSVATVLMVMFVWWEAPISMKVEWRCVSMTSGGQCVMTSGTTLMLLWSASSWDMHTLAVSILFSINAAQVD